MGGSEARLRAMCANAHAGLALLDLDLRCVQINGRLAIIDGLPPEAHLGHTPRDFIPTGESANGPFVLLRKPVPGGALVELAATLLERDLIPQ